jgi:hypothetical protein
MKKIYTLLSLIVFSFAANAQCTEIFFSEYSEGSSNNKYMEIYNPTNAAVDLSAYSIHQIGNGGSYTNDFQLYGTLASNAVFVFSTDQADASILAVADTALSYPSVAHFNGDDCMLLLNGTDTIDQLGERRVDPGSSWAVDTGSTKDYTLVRKFTVEGPDTAWASTSIMGWNVLGKDDWTNVGMHSSSCHPLAATEPSTAAADPTADAADVISIYSQSYTDPAGINYFPGWGQSTQYNIFEIGTDSMIKYAALNYQGIDFDASEIDASSMEMLHIDIWTADVDSVLLFPISRATGERSVNNVLTAGQWNSIDIPLSDFTSQGLSMADIWQLKFDNIGASRGAGTIFIDNMYLWKEPTLVYNVADIADIVGLDADFSPVNLDTLYEVTGIVYGIDFQGSATRTQFTLIDATDGVGVYTETSLDYVVKEGDEVTVKGPLGFFRGLTQIIADSITVVSTGNEIKDPTDVTSLSEDTESDFVMLTKVWLADDTETVWPSNGNIDVTNGVDTMTLRIDSDTKGIAGKTIENDTMNIVGLGGQFEFDAPYEGGYQLFPRDSTDITKWVFTAGVKEVTVDARVYPNPASNNLTVIGAQKWNTYVVYNILGGKVSEGTLTNNSLSVAELNGGTYIVKLYAGENTGVARFVVNK